MQGGSNELSKSNVREILSHGKDRSCIIGSVVGFMSWWIVSICVNSGGLCVFCLKNAAFRESKIDMASGFIVGLLIVAAWFVTGNLGFDEFEPTPIASFSFVAPIGEGLQYLMTFTGSKINFGIAVVGGILLGSFVSAKISGEFRIEAIVDAGAWLFNRAFIDHCWRHIGHEIPRRRQCHRCF